jgi:hypothetical protein
MIRTSVRRIASNTRMFKRLQTGGRSEGATVASKGGISDKEKAAENMWVREQVSGQSFRETLCYRYKAATNTVAYRKLKRSRRSKKPFTSKSKLPRACKRILTLLRRTPNKPRALVLDIPEPSFSLYIRKSINN